MRTVQYALVLVVVAVLASLAALFVAAALDMDLEVPRCAEDEVVTQEATCAHPDTGTFSDGYWHESDSGLIPPTEVSK